MTTYEYNNYVDFSKITKEKYNTNNLKQYGGTIKYINATIIYIKKVPLEKGYNDLYLVMNDMTAYKMYHVNLSNQYIVTVNIPVDQYFRFKFLRGNRLEILDEDIELRELSDVEPNANKNNNYNVVEPFDNLNNWTARWRWIKPDKNDSDYVYYFSYYIPYYIGIQRKRNVYPIANYGIEPLQYDYYTEDLKPVKKGNELVKIRDIDGSIKKNENGIDVEIILNIPVEINKDILVSENLGTESGKITEEKYRELVRLGVRNTNMISYFKNQINHNTNLVKAQFDSLINYINNINNLFNNSTPNTKPIQFHGINTYLLKPIYNYWSALYDITTVIQPNEETYIFFMDGLEHKFSTTIHLIENSELIEELDNIASIFENLIRVSVNCFNGFPMSILEYIHFFKKYKTENYNYAIKCLFLHSVNRSYININKYYIDNKQTILPTINNKLYDNQPYNYKNMITFDSTEKDIQKYFSEFTPKLLLTPEWIIKNIMQLYYEKSDLTLSGIVKTSSGYNNLITNGIISKLKNIIDDNTNTADINIFYSYLYQLDYIASKFNSTMGSPNRTNHIINDDENKLIFLKEYTNSVVKKINLIGDKEIYKKKLANYADKIYFHKYEIINEVMRLMERPIKLFAKSFWLNLNDISFTDFITSLTPVNRAKIYYKFAYIFTFIYSNLFNTNDSKIVTGSTIDNVENKPSINFYHLINNNDTLNKLFKLARHHMVRGVLTLKVPTNYIDNDILNLSQHYIRNIGNRLTPGKDIFNDDKVSDYQGITLGNGLSKNIMELMNNILYLVDDERNDGIMPDSDFIQTVDDLYTDTNNVSDSIDLIQYANLSY